MTRIIKQPEITLTQVPSNSGFTGAGLYQEMYLDGLTGSQWLVTVWDPEAHPEIAAATYLNLAILVAVDYRYGE